jgi:hypothetical protein
LRTRYTGQQDLSAFRARTVPSRLIIAKWPGSQCRGLTFLSHPVCLRTKTKAGGACAYAGSASNGFFFLLLWLILSTAGRPGLAGCGARAVTAAAGRLVRVLSGAATSVAAAAQSRHPSCLGRTAAHRARVRIAAAFAVLEGRLTPAYGRQHLAASLSTAVPDLCRGADKAIPSSLTFSGTSP